MPVMVRFLRLYGYKTQFMKQTFLFRQPDPREAGGGDNDTEQGNPDGSPSENHDEESDPDSPPVDYTESTDEDGEDTADGEAADDEE
jgi:hypothetical protein